MALAELIAALEADVTRKAAEHREAGRQEAERIRTAAAQRLAQEHGALLATRESSRRRALAAEVAESEAALRARLLEAREHLLASIFERVRERLPALQAGQAYRDGLAGELADALAYVDGDGDIAVRCAPSLVATLRPLLLTTPDLHLEADDGILAGFRVLADSGRVEVDRTLESRLRRLEPLLRIDLVHHLEALAHAPDAERSHALG